MKQSARVLRDALSHVFDGGGVVGVLRVLQSGAHVIDDIGPCLFLIRQVEDLSFRPE